MLIIPTRAVASQTMACQLANQPCRINVYQKTTGLYLDLYVNDAPIITGVVCLDTVRIVRDAYLGFQGDLAFFDTEGSSDPSYSGLGSRYQLAWLAPEDVA